MHPLTYFIIAIVSVCHFSIAQAATGSTEPGDSQIEQQLADRVLPQIMNRPVHFIDPKVSYMQMKQSETYGSLTSGMVVKPQWTVKCDRFMYRLRSCTLSAEYHDDRIAIGFYFLIAVDQEVPALRYRIVADETRAWY
jgi:hypothetical protein